MPLTTDIILNNRYRIVDMLGQGGFGAVYKAWDQSLQRHCAVKENLDVSEAAQRQFTREATILANIHHPNLPRVTDHFIVPEQGQYLVMDFVEGEDLQTRLNQAGGALPENEVLSWMAQVCDALIYLHSQNPPVIHRDIKPGNIRINPSGKVMLVDFGIAKVYDPNLKTTIGARAITPGFSPFEQYGNAPTDVRTDIYALGATAYYLLTGQEPTESITRVAGKPLTAPRQHNPSIRPTVERALLRALELMPDQRFQTIAEFKAALVPQSLPVMLTPTQLVTSGVSTPVSGTVPISKPIKRQSPRWLVPAIIAGVIVGCCALVGLAGVLGIGFSWESLIAGPAAPTATTAAVSQPPTQTPPPTNPPAAPPTATSSPVTSGGEVTILFVDGFPDEYDYWFFYGMLRNDTSQPVSDLQIQIQVFDANRNVIFTEWAYPTIYNISPGESTPFMAYSSDPLPVADTVEATLLGSNTISMDRTTVDFDSVRIMADNYNDIYITGEIINNQSNPVSVNGLGAGFFDSSGNLVTANSASVLVSYLDPGDRVPFRIMVDAPIGQAPTITSYHYSFYLDAVFTNPQREQNITVDADHFDYVDTGGDFHLVGDVTNNSEVPMWVNLIAGIYDANGTLLDASYYYSPVPIPPGETFPYDFSYWGPLNYVPGTYDAAVDYLIFTDLAYTVPATYYPYQLTTSDDTNTFDGYSLLFEGNVYNNSGYSVDYAYIIIGLYDISTGELVASEYTGIYDPLASGAYAPYSIYIPVWDGFDPDTVEYVISVWGE